MQLFNQTRGFDSELWLVIITYCLCGFLLLSKCVRFNGVRMISICVTFVFFSIGSYYGILSIKEFYRPVGLILIKANHRILNTVYITSLKSIAIYSQNL
jgi:hypothetical protein